MISWFSRFENWYERHERRISSFALLAGFIFDSLTLKRIDLLYENMVMLSYLLVSGGGILLINRFLEQPPKNLFLTKLEHYLPLFIQFAFGGLFSAFFIFYSRGGSVVASWPFILVLLGLLIGNEFFKNHYRRMVFQVSVYFLAVFSFAIFFVPIMLKSMGTLVFLLSGVVSLGFIYLFTRVLFRVVPKRYADHKINLRNSVATIFIVINALYLLNLIPPIPLSMKEIGVYYSVERVSEGYRVATKPADWRDKLPFLFANEIKLREGEPLYVLSSIFAPTDLGTSVVHDWQYFDSERKRWLSLSRIGFPIVGGRESGYRGFSRKENLFPGLWRVDVKTEKGQVVGRIRFRVEIVSGESERVIKTL